jgi:hypothetical protein
MGARVIPILVEIDTQKQGSISFLKKRNKKLLIILSLAALKKEGSELRLRTRNKSFLVLFFKKELLPWHLPFFGGRP